MPFVDFESAISILVAFGGVFVALRQTIRDSRIRVEHLKVAIAASNDFYDRAEILLTDPETPEIIRNMIVDFGVAVTSDKAGRKAASLIMRSIADFRHTGRSPKPNEAIVQLMGDLRRSRGDLYDVFHEALGAAFTAIVSAHTSSWQRSKLALNYDISGANRSRTLSLAEILDTAIAGWRPGGRGGQQAVCGAPG